MRTSGVCLENRDFLQKDTSSNLATAPFAILLVLFFGLYNLVDYALYALGSQFEPKLFVSNPRAYTYTKMIGFLLFTPVVELSSVVTRPAQVGIIEVPRALLRVLLATLNVPIGFISITVRAGDLAIAKTIGERPTEDVVAKARSRQGALEAEKLAVAAAEEGSTLEDIIVSRWKNLSNLTRSRR